MQSAIPITRLLDDLMNAVLNAAADLGYSRSELNQLTKDYEMNDDLARMIIDAVCREVSRSAGTWQTFARRTADEIASAVSARDSQAGIKPVEPKSAAKLRRELNPKTGE